MSKDLLADWKTSKFILVKNILTDTSDHVIVLSDIKFWTEYYTELQDWCKKQNAKVEGMTVSINTDKTLTLFILRWS
jgi:hypothetical protein